MKKVFDAHVHHEFEMPIEDAIRIFRLEFDATDTEWMAFMSIPNKADNDGKLMFFSMQNIRMLYLKYVFSPNAYAFAGLEHPLNAPLMDDGELSELYLAQAKKYHAAGYDGMKMLEGYPSLRKAMIRPLCHPVYDKYYSYLEENGIPVTMHLGNPEEYWDPERVDPYAKSVGRFCDETYPTKAELHAEVDEIMKKHPRLRMALAHFGFMSYDIEQAERWLGEHENTLFDLTPGGEQLLNMRDDWERWSSFFDKYRDRIIYGSDFYAFPEGDGWETNFMRRPKFLREFFETDTYHTYGKDKFRGVLMDEDILKRIYYENSFARLGKPRPIDLGYMRREAERLLALPCKQEKNADGDLRFILKNI